MEESQQSNVLTLERNSFNFLEYAGFLGGLRSRYSPCLPRYVKMQARAYPSATSEVPFDDVVPKTTSTRRVAAAAFYHCLGLSSLFLVGCATHLTTRHQFCRQKTSLPLVRRSRTECSRFE